VSALDSLIGESPAMHALRDRIRRVAQTELSVLISGPTGSGKELVARAIHQLSGRAGKFVAFNVGAIGETMFEDALFGHVRGAFTGAAYDSPGYLREAHRGTVFMDEVSRLRSSAQVSLLRALETREFRPVGDREDRRSDFRLVSATNDDLRDLVVRESFRDDLFHRLKTVTLVVPALSQRGDDVLMLTRHFLAEAAPPGYAVELTPAAKNWILSYRWPGNVRELKNMISAAVTLADGPIIDDELLSAVAEGGATVEEAATVTVGGRSRAELRKMLADVAWDVDGAAARLGVHRTTIYRWIRRHGIELPETAFRGRADPLTT
jgi:two-component system, NtrC family, response regulator GlrR